MEIIDYIFSRIVIFIILYVIWMSINGRHYAGGQSSSEQPSTTLDPGTSTEAEPLNETTPVNLIIINDENNEIANKSVTNSLKAIKDKNPDLIGKIITITVSGRDLTTDIDNICKVWDAAIQEDSTEVPNLLLDTTTVGYGAETVIAFTAAVGIPTLSAQFSQIDDTKNWQYPDADQNRYLVQVLQPTDLMPEVLRQLALQMNISTFGVIFDERFNMEHKYERLFVNVPAKLIIMPIKQSPDEIRQILIIFRKRHLYNYFILGGEETIRSAMTIGQSLNLTDPNYGWYALTEQDFEPRCDCKNVSIIVFKPLISSASNQRFADLALPAESPLTSAFYYDLVQLGTSAMRQSIAKGKWPTNATYLSCDDFDGENTPIRHFNYFEALVDVSAKFQSTLSGIFWGQKNNRNRAKFDMTAKMVTIVDGNPVSSKDVGTWSAGLDSHIQIKNDGVVRHHSGAQIYRITTVVRAPLVMYDPETKIWSGYSIDVLNEISSITNFSYVIHETYDKKVGSIDENGKWNGMIKELRDDKADIAIGTLPLMPEAESVVDFTLPCYDRVGLVILMKKPKDPTSLFKFLNVFDDDVWLCILGLYFFTTSFIWIFNCWSPYAYQKNREQSREEDETRRVFDFSECLWFSLTSLTPQGGGEVPMNWSGRVVAGTWWLFGFIIIASYTANLAAFLTMARLDVPIDSLEQLVNQYKIKYAPINGSTAHLYFERMTRIEKMFDGIWRDMNLNKSMNYEDRAKLAVWDYPVENKYTKIFEAMKVNGFPADMNEALRRIRNESSESDDFVLIGDAVDIRYLEMTNCDLIMVGSEFSRIPYAMAVRRDSVLKDVLNEGINELLMKHRLERLKMKWWDNNPNKAACNKKKKQLDEDESVSITNIGGVFIMVLVGIVLGFLTLAFEYYWYSYRPSNKTKFIRTNLNFEDKVKKTLPIKITVKPSKNAIETDQTRFRF